MDAQDVRAPLRTRLAGCCMVAGGITLAVPPFLGPPSGSDGTRDRLVDLAADPDTTVAKSLVLQAALLLLLPGVAALAGRVRGRGSGAVVSGAVVFGAGLVGAVPFVMMFGVEATLAASGPVDDRLVGIAEAIEASPTTVPAAVLALLLFHFVGLPWLAFGLMRARQLPVVVAVAATVGTLCAFFGSGTRVETVGWVVIGASLAYVGWTVTRPAAPTRIVDPSGTLASAAT